MRLLRACPLFFAALLIALAGCKPEDEISEATVTHPDRQEIRLCVGAIKRGEFVWFFRLSGPSAEVADHLAEFKGFVRSVKFADNADKQEEPTWTEPKGWRKDVAAPTALRYACLRIDAKPKEMEVTVSRLETGANWELQNVHRWQKEVNLPPASKIADLTPDQWKVEGDIIWIDFTGLGVHTVSKAPDPAARGDRHFQMPIMGQRPAKGGVNSPFTYAVPESWKAADITSNFMAARFISGDVQISLTTVGGSLAMNINRWRKEVGLPMLDDDAAAEKLATPMQVAGRRAYYVDIANANGPPGKNRSLAVTIPMGQTNWFVKMWGPADAVERNKNTFETFVKSFKLE